MFMRLKRLLRLVFVKPSGDVPGKPDDIDNIQEAIVEIFRDLANVHTALQRIERKQLRWLEMYNGLQPPKPDGDKEAAPLPQRPVTPAALVPGQIVP